MAFGKGDFCLSGDDYYCPYDHFPCSRYDKDLGFGVCEVTMKGNSDVCPRFALKSNVMYVEFFSKKALGEIVARRSHGLSELFIPHFSFLLFEKIPNCINLWVKRIFAFLCFNWFQKWIIAYTSNDVSSFFAIEHADSVYPNLFKG